uniref:hypothetical protein n=1 Tax=Aliarcobacter sp. TaxID=2321116 RepID=UPI0040489CD3
MNNLVEIEKWLKAQSINNYLISEDFYVTVQGNVNLNGKILNRKLPIKFKTVDGYFDISNNKLVTLEGCPSIVTRDFNCSNNNLTSLFEGPNDVGDFDCSHNELVNLSYAPKEVKGNFDCSHNQITSIKGSPRTIKGFFKCSNNKISSLKGGPKYIETYFDCSENHLERLIDGPVSVGHDYICSSNSLADLDGVADEIGWDLITDFRLNHVTSSFNEEENYWRYKGSEVIAHIYKPIVALTNIDDINRWLRQHDIRSFTILKDNSVNVHGNVKLSDKLANLLKLPLNFNIVEGDFDISDNQLTSLEGCPKKVQGSFLAYKNELSSLKGGPKEVDGSYIVLHNNITSLDYAPSIVKDDFICSHNPLKDLKGLNIVLGYVFTGVYLPNLKCQKYVYKGVTTYKYASDVVTQYLDKEYISFTDEEKAFEETRKNLEKVIQKMLDEGALKKAMINDILIKNLSKYHLNDLKTKVLLIKNPPIEENLDRLSEDDIMKLAFQTEI